MERERRIELDINKIIDEVRDILIQKRSYYGDTFIERLNALCELLSHKINERGNYELTRQDLMRLLIIVRILDKISRLLYGNNGDESAWIDLIGYGVLGEELERREKHE